MWIKLLNIYWAIAQNACMICTCIKHLKSDCYRVLAGLIQIDDCWQSIIFRYDTDMLINMSVSYLKFTWYSDILDNHMICIIWSNILISVMKIFIMVIYMWYSLNYPKYMLFIHEVTIYSFMNFSWLCTQPKSYHMLWFMSAATNIWYSRVLRHDIDLKNSHYESDCSIILIMIHICTISVVR